MAKTLHGMDVVYRRLRRLWVAEPSCWQCVLDEDPQQARNR